MVLCDEPCVICINKIIYFNVVCKRKTLGKKNPHSSSNNSVSSVERADLLEEQENMKVYWIGRL